MAIFRINKTKDYTVMSNYHLRDRELSLKGKGLLSLMLSLPENWDFTLKGLAIICKDGIDSVRKGVSELEQRGYLSRRRLRGADGRLGDIEYTILEVPVSDNASGNDNNNDNSCDNNSCNARNNKTNNSTAYLNATADDDDDPEPISATPISGNRISDLPTPQSPMSGIPTSASPTSENPIQVKPIYENPTQLNTKVLNTNKSITNRSNIHQSIYPRKPDFTQPLEENEIDTIEAIDVYREIIKENIDYANLCTSFSHSIDEINEILELMLEVICTKRKTIRIGGEDRPAELVKSRMLKLDYSHIEYVMDCMNKNTTDVRNIKGYMLTALFNAPTTIGSHYKARVNHDLYGI
ncbi:MAG: helix-turn-helix domain-containing protein [Oscillospiraceae bacterium]|jgi:hypothetical protein|nr:helix-turn-helix domain-containing protein [Oscillospiraceae bacterium]